MPRRTKEVKTPCPVPAPLWVPSVEDLKRRMNKSKTKPDAQPGVTTPKRKKAPTGEATVANPGPLKLRFGTGEEEGFTKLPQTWKDKIFIPSPWKLDGKNIADQSVDTVFFAWYFQRLSQSERFITMNEAFRVLRFGGQVMIASPYWSSRRAVADPLAMWPPLAEESFYVYSRVWREQEGLKDLVPLNCDFASMTPQGQLIIPSGHIPDPEVAQRNEEYRQHASRHFVNSVWEL